MIRNVLNSDDMQHTALGYALIGLVQEEPRTGYALRKVFETTPMGTFSSSPGSIYPALKKLVQAGMIEQRLPEVGSKKRFHITPDGEREMKSWLIAPVTTVEVANSVDVALLRFAFLQNVKSTVATRRFLKSFQSAVREQIDTLETYLSGPASVSLSRHGRLAVENGLLGYKAHLEWAIHAAKEFET